MMSLFADGFWICACLAGKNCTLTLYLLFSH